METKTQYKTPPDNGAKMYSQADFDLVFNSVARLTMARVLQGQTAYQGNRNYYEVLGYPTSIEISDYVLRYERQDIAARIVDLPALDSWKEPPKVSEADESETPFVREFEALNNRLKVWNALTRADRLSGIGHFGILLIGFKDAGELSAPVDAKSIQGQKGILYLRPLSEAFVTVGDMNEDTKSPRFGQPENYRVTLDDNRAEQIIHWSRVIHLAENKLDSEVFGVPRLRAAFNLLDDKMKAVGGIAEAAWINMRPGTAVSPEEDFTWDDTDAARQEWLKEVERYLHDPARMLRLRGMKAQQIGTSEVIDPAGLHGVIIADMAAATGIPQRVLIGSAGGELSAAKEDTRQWAATIANRQKNYVEQEILRPFIDRLVSMGALPAPGGGPGAYNVGALQPDGSYAWPSIIELSEEEKAAATMNQAAAAKNLADPAGNIPLSDDEKRQLLRLPPRETEPTEEDVTAEVFKVVAQNRRDGLIGDDELVAHMAAGVLERTGAFDEV